MLLLPLLSCGSLLRVLADASLALGNLVVLNGVLQHYDAALRARNCAANGDQVKLSVNLYNVQVLNSNLLSAM